MPVPLLEFNFNPQHIMRMQNSFVCCHMPMFQEVYQQLTAKVGNSNTDSVLNRLGFARPFFHFEQLCESIRSSDHAPGVAVTRVARRRALGCDGGRAGEPRPHGPAEPVGPRRGGIFRQCAVRCDGAGPVLWQQRRPEGFDGRWCGLLLLGRGTPVHTQCVCPVHKLSSGNSWVPFKMRGISKFLFSCDCHRPETSLAAATMRRKPLVGVRVRVWLD